jgi:hypothetical protein
MSFIDVFSHWRCPNCKHDNRYNLTWQHYYIFNEVEPEVEYSDETCENCGTKFWVAKCEPQMNCFPSMQKPNASLCKNDYIKDLVLSKDLPLTIKKSYFTD